MPREHEGCGAHLYTQCRLQANVFVSGPELLPGLRGFGKRFFSASSASRERISRPPGEGEEHFKDHVCPSLISGA